MDGGVPRTLVLIVAGRDGHHLVATLGELDGEGADDVTETAGLGPGGNLGGDEDDLHGARRLGGVGHLRAGLRGWKKRTYGGSIGELSVGFLRWSAAGRGPMSRRETGAAAGRAGRPVDARGRRARSWGIARTPREVRGAAHGRVSREGAFPAREP